VARIAAGLLEVEAGTRPGRQLEHATDHPDRVRRGRHRVADEPDRGGPLGSKPLRQAVGDVSQSRGASRTRRLVSVLILADSTSFSAADAVAIETPAAEATSRDPNSAGHCNTLQKRFSNR
jgi:hypothetical protein